MAEAGAFSSVLSIVYALATWDDYVKLINTASGKNLIRSETSAGPFR